ncbi:MAG: hypothetical protein SGJ05_07110 [bacterium]|nr:hypothetical protein [bacterium]
MSTRTGFIAIALTFLICVSCKEKNPVTSPSEEEVITTVTMELTDSATGSKTAFIWEDIDGAGGNPPNRIDTIRIVMGSIYTATVKVENRSVTPTEDITVEIRNLLNQHQFFFAISNGIARAVSTDIDDLGKPVGLSFRLTPLAADQGVFTVALSHYETRELKDGITPSDETDISVTFPLIVQ